MGMYDAAVLCVPNQVKLGLLNYLLRAGKHALVEKPLLLPDPKTAQHLNDLARSHDCIWYTSYNNRFEPNVIRLKQLLKEGMLGSFYHARLVYGNGTVQNCIGTWREGGYGVLEDLGCHLIDLIDFLFNDVSSDFLIWKASKIESQVFDHCIFATSNGKIVLECALLMWKNTFTIDVYGRLGSLHLRGLCKWGPSELLIHQRVLPSGIPIETREVVEQDDRTWHLDIREFEKRVKSRETSFVGDLRISKVLQGLVQKAADLL